MATAKGHFPPLSGVVYSSKALRYSVPWGLALLFWVGVIALAAIVLHGVGL